MPGISGGEGVNRTLDTRIFSPLVFFFTDFRLMPMNSHNGYHKGFLPSYMVRIAPHTLPRIP